MAESALRTRVLTLATAVEETSARALREASGVEAAECLGQGRVRLRYDVRATGVDVLLSWLSARGIRAEPGWRTRLRHAWMAYADAVAREALAAEEAWESSLRRLYAGGWPGREGARSDLDAHHWRRYLSRAGNRP
jgi:hypothetical protein